MIYMFPIFVGAFLLFQVQPLIAKIILPWFGGAPAVWSACMLFFQLILFLGYLYAHLLAKCLKPRVGLIVHSCVVVLSLLLLGLHPDPSWKPLGETEPVGHIVKLLLFHVGIPYFVLSATSPLVQVWFSRTYPGRSPYFLYAFSNIGSLLALLSYPVAIEPFFRTHQQTDIWSWVFIFFSVLIVASALFTLRSIGAEAAEEEESASEGAVETRPSAADLSLWFSLAAVGSILLLAFTNHVCHDVAVVPFLWVVPLALYLASFILCFESDRWYLRERYVAIFGTMLLFFFTPEFKNLLIGPGAPVWFIIMFSFGAMFLGCMICHGELYESRPSPKYLTIFYLMMSAGGAAGGIFVGLLSPYIFDGYFEFYLGLILVPVLLLVVLYRDKDSVLFQGKANVRWTGAIALVFGVSVVTLQSYRNDEKYQIDAGRNFYGLLRVKEADSGKADVWRRTLTHGQTMHGYQFMEPTRRREATAYYREGSGVQFAFNLLGQKVDRKIGIIGLGVGGIAAWGRAGDVIRFYEINSLVRDLAEKHFSFLSDSPATIEHRLGDARLVLEREEDQQFDLLILDAFSSDAIPVHLLTKEAMSVYRRHIKPDGLMAVHITNRHFDLRGVLRGLAESEKMHLRVLELPGEGGFASLQTIWALLSPDENLLYSLEPHSETKEKPLEEVQTLYWTDDYSSILDVFY